MENIKKVPALRFSEFSGEWEVKKISQILKPISEKVEVEENEFYRQIGIRSHGKGLFHKEPVSGESLGNKRVFWVKENAFVVNIVFAWEQAVAKTTLNELGMIASHRFPMYQPLNNLCSIDYILYFFLTKKGKSLLELASPGGAGRNKTLGQAEFKKLKFLIPSAIEQQKIADFLTCIDTKIEQLTKKKQLLESYKKGVMQKIFSQELRFKDDNGNNYPDWEVKKLKNIAEINPKNDSLPNEFIYIDLESVENGNLLKETLVIKSEAPSRAQRLLKKEDILFQMVRPYQKNNLFFDKTGNYVASTGYAQIRAYENPSFLYYLLHLDDFVTEVMNRCTGTSYPAINSTDLGIIFVKVPSLLEQTQIANFLTAIDDKINLVEKQLNGTKEYKKGLLQQMFV